MEILIYLADVLLTGWLLFWCGRNTDRPGGAPVVGLFGYREAPTAPSASRTGPRLPARDRG